MNCMGTELHWASTPVLLPGETERAKWPRVWYMIAKSRPTYRHFFPLPPLFDGGCTVTDSRILLSFRMFPLMAQHFSVWFPGKAPRAGMEMLEHAAIIEPPPAGPWWKFREAPACPCLEIISKEPNKHWYRSQIMRLRLFTRDHVLLERFLSAIQYA